MKISRRHAILGGGAFGLVAVGGLVALRTPLRAQDVRLLTPPEALAEVRAGKLLLVDVRRPDEWSRTGIAEGAVPIDLRRDDFIEAVRAARANPQQPIAVICARGVRSARMTRALTEAGITPLVDVPEGMLGSRAGPGWLERGLPVREYNE
ncbi:MAG: rhodanese-like domain-containing protein [Pseudomonadota bacterium]